MKHVVTAALIQQRVLVTGFGAFPGVRRNPTATVIAALARHRSRFARLGVALDTLCLPVVYAEIEEALAVACRENQPDAILHLGLASRRGKLCVETRAVNRAGSLHPDASRRRPDPVLVSGGPQILGATYPAAQILSALSRKGFAVKRSIDAGDYVCNATLYRTLRAASAPRVGFLHVPRVMRLDQPKARASGRPSLDDLTRAVVLAVLEMARPAARPPRVLSRNDAPTYRSSR